MASFLEKIAGCRFYFKLFLLFACFPAYAVSPPGGIYVEQKGQDVTLSWGSVSGAESYTFYWAPKPGASPISSVNMGLKTSLSVKIGVCEAYYVAVTASKKEDAPVIDPVTGVAVIDPVTGDPVLKKVIIESSYSGIGIVRSINPSFFPIRTCGGALASNSWNFLLNKGLILVDTATKFSPGDMKFNSGSIKIDTGAIQFIKSSSGTYIKGGVAQGSYSEDNFNDLVLSPANDAFSNKISEVYIDQFISDAVIGLSSKVEATSIIKDSPINPISFPLTRKDLHTLSIGTVIGSSNHASTKSSIDVFIKQPIIDSRYLETIIDFNSVWTLVGKMKSISVLGKDYYNIVIVENVISGQYMNLSGEVEKQDRTITYWLSRGVGMVKSLGAFSATGAFSIDSKPLLVELESYVVQD